MGGWVEWSGMTRDGGGRAGVVMEQDNVDVGFNSSYFEPYFFEECFMGLLTLYNFVFSPKFVSYCRILQARVSL